MKTLPLFIASALIASATLSATERVALVIGNGAYSSAKLPNPVNDAPLVAASLQKVGFKVIQKTDLTRDGMRAAVREFSDALKKGDTALFYYAGHGAQVKDENYLIPVDAPLGMKEYEAEDRSVKVNLALAAMEECGSALNIVILDCCRDNPFARSWRSASNGLAEMKAPQETLIAYATAPGKAASDGEGANSPYSQALAEEILRPGVKLQDVFLNVARRVHATTKGEQRPWTASDLLSEFVFLQGSNQAVAQPVMITTHTKVSTPITEQPTASEALPSTAIPAELPTRGYFSISEIFKNTRCRSYTPAGQQNVLRMTQAKLAESGHYKGNVDGVMGPGTQRAILEWQIKESERSDGKLNDVILQKLGVATIEDLPPTPPATIPPANPQGDAIPEPKGARPILYYFSASWCPPCAQMKNNVFPSLQIQALKAKFDWREIDVDASKNASLCKRFNIASIPHFVAASPSGRTLATQTGGISVANFAAFLQKALSASAH
jgi:peptidoglycan hydrolase-like protein with peptidoglycan-binding domain